ncbi:MAG: hypothetical protein ACD_45C00427G0001 [uncultured bacterium]|nr:MAG: hypothetical protein ACD_45C00427G0001 [uncultured bacterium]
MQITQQEIEIMKFLNECGFCAMQQVGRQFNLKKTRTYRLLKRLRNIGLVKYKRVMYESPGVYFLSAKGSEYSDLPPIDKVSAGRFEHQMKVNDVFIQLTKQYPEAHWISERRLMRDKYQNGLGKKGHLCDGILVFDEMKYIAIEVELNSKAHNRVEKIVKGYITQFKFHEVWYFCAPNVLSMMTALAGRFPFIKIYNLNEFLSC